MSDRMSKWSKDLKTSLEHNKDRVVKLTDKAKDAVKVRYT